MSDKLSEILQIPSTWAPSKTEDPDQRVIDALQKALDATTPERAGCPWDEDDKEEGRNESGIWIVESD